MPAAAPTRVSIQVRAKPSVVLPSPVGGWAGVALVATLVAVPMARVLWLVARWIRRGDRRYAAVGAGVLAVIVAGALLALICPAAIARRRCRGG